MFDERTGVQLPLGVILVTSILLGLIMLGLAVLFYRTRNLRKQGASDELLGKKGVVVKTEKTGTGLMSIHGETWKFKYKEGGEIKEGDDVQVEGYEGLTLVVKRWSD